LDALDALVALGSGRTCGASRACRSDVALSALRTLGTCRSGWALDALGACRSGRSGVARGTRRSGRALDSL